MKRTELLSKLELVGMGLANSNRIPIFTHYVFLKEGTIYAYNDLLGVMADNEPLEQSFAIPGDTIKGLLQNLSSEDVTLTPDSDNVTLKASKSTFKIPLLDEKAFLFEVPEIAGDYTIEINADFCEGLEAVMLTACRDESMPALKGVTIDKSGTLFTCDSDAISRYTIEEPVKLKKGASKNFMLSNEFCEAILKIWRTCAPESGTLQINGEWAYAAFSNGYDVCGRMKDNSNGLDHVAQLEGAMKEDPTWAEIPGEFNMALSRARVLTDKDTSPTVLEVKKNKLLVKTETFKGEGDDFIALKHPDMKAKVNAALIQRTLSLYKEASIHQNCTVLRNGEKMLCLIANMG